jgi:hypothetical protein
MSTGGDGDVLGETYLRERGVLVETFLSHGGEIDSSPHCAKISERLNRNLDRVRLSEEWKAVKEILVDSRFQLPGRACVLAGEAPARFQEAEVHRTRGQRQLAVDSAEDSRHRQGYRQPDRHH